MILVALGLNQIQLMKKQIKDQKNANQINAKRDALKITSEQITKYGTEIIPLINALNEKIKSEKIEFFKKSKAKITNDQIEVSVCKETKEVEKLDLIVREFITAINAIEGFSIYFTSGVADEGIAYRSLSTTFCSTIKDLLPLIVQLTDNENRFDATLKLFSIWNSRIESKTLEKQMKELEQKFKNSKSQVIKIVGFNAETEN